ncbi:MFS transporter [Shumkonia mesophila]|uniref:MFS transporter n=1 Tax=Shumkonia mesophila TaxID=2838854 RepID=UPI002934F26A|nr:MFS transporter [Shumkonia mesophila]
MNKNRRPETSAFLAPAFRPWAVWSVGALFFCYAFFQRMVPSVTVADIMRDFGVGGAVLGNLAAFYFYAYAGLQIPVGVTIDRFGPRRVLAAAAVLSGAGSLMFALAPTIGVAYMGRLLVGAGAGFALIGTLKLCAVWFPPERFALVTGLTTMLGAFGAINGQAPLAAAIGAVGWRATMVVAALVAVAIGGLIWAIARDRRDDAPPPAIDVRPSVFRGIGGLLATPANWVLPLIMGSMAVPMLAFAGLWGVPFMMEAYGLERPAAAATTSIFLVGHAIGSVLMGWFSDRIRRRKPPMVIGTAVTTCATAALVFLPGLPLLAAQALLLAGGIASGATPVGFAFTREHNRAERAATAMGLVNLLNMGIAAVFQPLLGWLLDLNWDGRLIEGARIYSVATFRTAFLSMVVLGVAGIVAALLVRETRCQPLEDRGSISVTVH